MSKVTKTRLHQSGISYVEVLAAVIIIAVTAVPAINALRGAMHVSESDGQATINHYRLLSKMEAVLAESHATLSAAAAGVATATSFSDAAGSADRRLVFIAPYDGDNADADNDPFTGADDGLLWVKAEIEGSVSVLYALHFE